MVRHHSPQATGAAFVRQLSRISQASRIVPSADAWAALGRVHAVTRGGNGDMSNPDKSSSLARRVPRLARQAAKRARRVESRATARPAGGPGRTPARPADPGGGSSTSSRLAFVSWRRAKVRPTPRGSYDSSAGRSIPEQRRRSRPATARRTRPRGYLSERRLTGMFMPRSET